MSHNAFMVICQLNVIFDKIPMLECIKDTKPHPAWFFRVSMETNIVSVHPTMASKLLPETELLMHLDIPEICSPYSHLEVEIKVTSASAPT